MPRKSRSDNDRLLSSDKTSYDDHSSFLGGDQATATSTNKRRKLIMGAIGIAVVLIVIAIGLVIYFKKEDDKSDDGDNIWESFRLPTDVKPIQYVIEYTEVNRVEFFFVGTVNISLAILNPVKTILIHASELNITDVSFNDATGVSMKLSNQFFYDTNNYFVVQFSEVLPVQSGAYIVLGFNGTLNDGMRGFYRSSYNSSNNEKQYLAVTQFEPTDARMAFPCFDEPAFKANFTVRITAEQNAVVLSNMPEATVTMNADTTKTVLFQTTPIMSTYLVAFAVGELINQTTTLNNINFGIYSDPQKPTQLATPLWIASQVTEAFANQIQIPYTLPKQDQLAVNDFSAGAMENWGLITYRETALLYNSNISSENDLQRAASTIAHEIAHQWTGDLVTMQFWNELWLNEGFATFLSYLGVDAVYPTWVYMESFVPGTLVAALSVDSSASTRAIVADVASVGEISAMFDTITYNKGGSVLRMMYNFFTPSVFMLGLKNYLTDLSYQNAQSSQFFDHVNTVYPNKDKFNVKNVMMPWITQPGYPVLTITETFLDNETVTFTITQKRFFASSSQPGDSTRWQVPIMWRFMNNNGTIEESGTIMSDQADSQIELIASSTELTSFKLNLNQTTFCRVQYSQYTWDLIVNATRQSDFGGLTVDDRSGLWSDSFALGYAGLYKWDNVLNFTRYVANERNLNPWIVGMSSLNGLYILTRNALANAPSTDPTMNLFTTYIGIDLLESITCEIRTRGWVSQNDHRQDLLTALIFRSATTYGACSAKADAVEFFDQYMQSNGTDPLWPEIASTIYSVGVAARGRPGYNFIFGLYTQAQTQADRERYLFGLSSTIDIDLLNDLLQLALNSSAVRKGDCASLMLYISQNPLGLKLVQNFVVANIDQIDAYLASGFGGLSRIISAIITPVADATTLKSITDKFDTSPVIQNGSVKLTYNQAVAVAKENIAFGTTQLPQIQAWLSPPS